MTHSKAVIILDQLVPSINSSGDPAGVFIKYAKDNNLAPAELERLCQLFNTAKSITHMQKSASRGSNHMILPVEDIVAEYTTYKAPTKTVTKSASEVLNHDPFEIPDIQKYLDKGGETVVKTASDHLRWDEDAFQGLLKLAHEKEAQEKAMEEQMFLETVKDLQETSMRQSWKLMDKLAMQMVKDENLFATLERDSLGVEGHNKKAFINLDAWMQKYHSATPYTRFDMTKSASVKLTRDTTGLLNEVNALTELINTVEECDSFIKTAVNPFATQRPSAENPTLEMDTSDSTVQDRLDSMREELLRANAADPSGEQRKEILEQIESNLDLLAGETGVAVEDLREQFKNTADLTEDEVNTYIGGGIPQGTPEFVDPPVPPTPPTDPQTDAPPERGRSNYIGSLENPKKPSKPDEGWKPVMDQVDKTVKSMGDMSGATLGWLKEKLTATPNFDKRRYAVDSTRNAVRNALNLQRAMITDPILSEADPNRLVSLYNSLSEANPDVMSDPNLLAYTLREAIQYDGVAPHTYEQLVSIDKAKSEATKNKNTAIDTEYKIN